jgi:Asp-tRNA(Asn)/Glu-tRNA(Gln) amidotransferase A subunit family amidase
MADLITRPLAEIARALCEKHATARELVEQAIARHGRFDERLHAYLLWTPDKARAVAQAAGAAFAAGRRLANGRRRTEQGPQIDLIRDPDRTAMTQMRRFC